MPKWSLQTSGQVMPTTELPKKRRLRRNKIQEMVIGLAKGAWTITLLSEKPATFATWVNSKATEWLFKSKPKIQLSSCKLKCNNSNGANSRCQCLNNTIIWISINIMEINKVSINNIDKWSMKIKVREFKVILLYIKTQSVWFNYFVRKNSNLSK